MTVIAFIRGAMVASWVHSRERADDARCRAFPAEGWLSSIQEAPHAASARWAANKKLASVTIPLSHKAHFRE
jgi:hypothetical protein